MAIGVSSIMLNSELIKGGNARVRNLVLVLLASITLLACEPAPDAAPAPGGDFAVLAQGDERYAQAEPGTRLSFPEDHGAHPDYRIEWWYVTANLQDREGRDWGLQWTLFRTAVTPNGEGPEPTNPWQQGQVYLAHFAISAPDQHRAFQRYARGGDHGGVRQAGVSAAPFAAWLDEWRLESLGADWLPLGLFASQDGVEARLRLESDLPLVLQGEAGFSQKHPDGGGSYYYSHPFLTASGELSFGGETVDVEGTAWLDREWSSQFLQPDQEGWDWFALKLDDGSRLMAFQLRSPAGDPYRHAVRLWPDGRRVTAAPAELQLSVLGRERVAGRDLPLDWSLVWAEQGLDLRVRSGLRDQWMDLDFPYYEGRIEALDRSGERVGVGYLEMTGYRPDDR